MKRRARVTVGRLVGEADFRRRRREARMLDEAGRRVAECEEAVYRGARGGGKTAELTAELKKAQKDYADYKESLERSDYPEGGLVLDEVDPCSCGLVIVPVPSNQVRCDVCEGIIMAANIIPGAAWIEGLVCHCHRTYQSLQKLRRVADPNCPQHAGT